MVASSNNRTNILVWLKDITNADLSPLICWTYMIQISRVRHYPFSIMWFPVIHSKPKPWPSYFKKSLQTMLFCAIFQAETTRKIYEKLQAFSSHKCAYRIRNLIILLSLKCGRMLDMIRNKNNIWSWNKAPVTAVNSVKDTTIKIRNSSTDVLEPRTATGGWMCPSSLTWRHHVHYGRPLDTETRVSSPLRTS